MLAGIAGITGAASYVEEAASEPVASFVFSGAGAGVGQVLYRTNVTSSHETKTMTFSCWAKVDTYKIHSGANKFFTFWTETSDDTFHNYVASDTNLAITSQHVNYPFTQTYAYEHGGTSSSTAWRHLVYRFDYSNGTASNRVRVYIDGSQIAAQAEVAPSTSVNIPLLENGEFIAIGSEPTADGRIAFPELVVGQSLAPTEFAFNDGGTWTAKKYTGSYGTYGFRLDGTGGANGCNDVSGNGMHFTPTNWNVSNNLDYSELPPRNF